MRMVLARPAHRQLSQVFYRYRSHGGSLTFSGADIRDTASRHLLDAGAHPASASVAPARASTRPTGAGMPGRSATASCN